MLAPQAQVPRPLPNARERALGRLCALVVTWAVAWAASAEEPPPRVAVLVRSAGGDAVFAQLEQLGVAIVHREPAERASEAELLVLARSLGESQVVWVDDAAASISVLRPSDGMVLTRVLAPRTLAEDPYVVALAASELLELMARTPPPRVNVDVRAEPAQERPRARRVPLSVALLVGGELAAAPHAAPTLYRPLLGLDATHTGARGLLLRAGLLAAPLGVSTQAVPGTTPGRVRYRRTDLALTLGLGVTRRDAQLVAHLSAGVGVTRASAEGVPDRRALDERRAQITAGSGVAFRYAPGGRVGLAFAVDVAWLTAPARYLVDGVLTLRETPVRTAVSLALFVRLR